MPRQPFRLNITRRRRSRMVAGVCTGVAAALGVEVGVIRLAAVLLALCGGLGIVAYGVLWISLQESTKPIGRPRRGAAIDSVAILALSAGAGLMARSGGYWVGDKIALPALAVAGGAALLGGRDESARNHRTRGWPLRVALGLSLVAVGGVVSAAVASGGWRTVGQSGLGALALVAGVAFLLWPWLGRLSTDLKFEQRERIRSQERADMAAHLHDGVLQTLALIQRRAEDPKDVRAMARRQERELREWLFEPDKQQIDSVGTLLRRECAAVEDDHQIRVEVVSSGDAPLDDAARALVAAGREAVVNAARHAKVDKIDVYMQADAESVELFVRDRGVGFDPVAIDEDRHGVAESIKGRVERAGGTATIRTAPGEGTEIELRVPGEDERVRAAVTATKVFIVDDHPLVRSGVRTELGDAVSVIGEAGDVVGAVKALLSFADDELDVVLLDVHMPGGGGEEILRRVTPKKPFRFLALSVSDEPDDVIRVIRAGARGYITKSATGTEIVEAIARVAAGDAAFSPKLAGFVLDTFRSGVPSQVSEAPVDTELEQLTPREREVLQLIARGYAYKEVGRRLDVSVKTVETHVSSVLRKLQLSSRHELARWATDRRLI